MGKRLKQPYLGIVDGVSLTADPELLRGKRSRMKLLLPNRVADLPFDQIASLLNTMMFTCERKRIALQR